MNKSEIAENLNLNGGICEGCSRPVIHRHRRRVTSGACEDVLSFCRKCDEGGECDYCLPESALYFYEHVHCGSGDDLADEAMIGATFTVEFAENFLNWTQKKGADHA